MVVRVKIPYDSSNLTPVLVEERKAIRAFIERLASEITTLNPQGELATALCERSVCMVVLEVIDTGKQKGGGFTPASAPTRMAENLLTAQ